MTDLVSNVPAKVRSLVRDVLCDYSTDSACVETHAALPCGHTEGDVVQGVEGTAYCGECAAAGHKEGHPLGWPTR